MPGDTLDKRSADSEAMLGYWDQIDAILGGIETMREAGEDYLKKFPGETEASFDFRLNMTKFTNIFRDIAESLASKPFEEEIGTSKEDGNDVPQLVADFIEDVDGHGNNLTVFAAETFFNGITYAIDWIFIDYPKSPETVRTKEDQARANLRPFWSHVLARNVLKAETKPVGGKRELSYIKILEPGSPNQIREFERLDTGLVIWKLSEKNKDGEWAQIDNGTLTIDIIPLVPLITGRRDGNGFKLFPPLRDAADLQIEHYLQESALKFTKVLSAYPMLAGNGVKPPKDDAGKPIPIEVGPMKVLYAPPDGSGNSGSWTFIEPGAQTLKFLADDIKETAQQLRELGKQPLTSQSGNLTVITTAVAAGKSKSAVAAWALMLKDALENALVITNKWLKIPDETWSPELTVYTDFDNITENGSDVEALDKSRERGDLSRETHWKELKRRRILGSDFDAEKEAIALKNEIPADDFGDDDDAETLPDDPDGQGRNSLDGENNDET